MMDVSGHLNILVTLTSVKGFQCPLHMHMKFAGPQRHFECGDEENNFGHGINPVLKVNRKLKKNTLIVKNLKPKNLRKSSVWIRKLQ